MRKSKINEVHHLLNNPPQPKPDWSKLTDGELRTIRDIQIKTGEDSSKCTKEETAFLEEMHAKLFTN